MRPSWHLGHWVTLMPHSRSSRAAQSSGSSLDSWAWSASSSTASSYGALGGTGAGGGGRSASNSCRAFSNADIVAHAQHRGAGSLGAHDELKRLVFVLDGMKRNAVARGL